MAVFFVQRVGNSLAPDGDESIAEFADVPFGKTLRCEVKQPRNLSHHKLFWGLCARIGKGIGHDAQWVERAFCVETGHYDIYKFGGKTHLVIRSIAFQKMDQIQFREFFEKCVQIAYSIWKIDPASVADLLAREETQARK